MAMQSSGSNDDVERLRTIKALFSAAKNGCISVVTDILTVTDSEGDTARYNLLTAAQKDGGDTVIHVAARNGQTKGLKVLTVSITCEQKRNLLTLKNDDGDTALFLAAQHGYTDTVQYLLGLVDSDSKLEMLKVTNSCGRTALHIAVFNGFADLVDVISACLSRPELCQLPQLQDKDGRSPIFEAAAQGHALILTRLLGSIEQDGRLQVLLTPNSDQETCVHTAASLGHSDVVRVIIELLSFPDWFSLLTTPNSSFKSMISLAAEGNYLEILQCIASSLAANQRQILTIQDIGDRIVAIRLAHAEGKIDNITVHIPIKDVQALIGVNDTNGQTIANIFQGITSLTDGCNIRKGNEVMQSNNHYHSQHISTDDQRCYWSRSRADMVDQKQLRMISKIVNNDYQIICTRTIEAILVAGVDHRGIKDGESSTSDLPINRVNGEALAILHAIMKAGMGFQFSNADEKLLQMIFTYVKERCSHFFDSNIGKQISATALVRGADNSSFLNIFDFNQRSSVKQISRAGSTEILSLESSNQGNNTDATYKEEINSNSESQSTLRPQDVLKEFSNFTDQTSTQAGQVSRTNSVRLPDSSCVSAATSAATEASLSASSKNEASGAFYENRASTMAREDTIRPRSSHHNSQNSLTFTTAGSKSDDSGVTSIEYDDAKEPSGTDYSSSTHHRDGSNEHRPAGAAIGLSNDATSLPSSEYSSADNETPPTAEKATPEDPAIEPQISANAVDVTEARQKAGSATDIAVERDSYKQEKEFKWNTNGGEISQSPPTQVAAACPSDISGVNELPDLLIERPYPPAGAPSPQQSSQNLVDHSVNTSPSLDIVWQTAAVRPVYKPDHERSTEPAKACIEDSTFIPDYDGPTSKDSTAPRRGGDENTVCLDGNEISDTLDPSAQNTQLPHPISSSEEPTEPPAERQDQCGLLKQRSNAPDTNKARTEKEQNLPSEQSAEDLPQQADPGSLSIEPLKCPAGNDGLEIRSDVTVVEKTSQLKSAIPETEQTDMFEQQGAATSITHLPYQVSTASGAKPMPLAVISDDELQCPATKGPTEEMSDSSADSDTDVVSMLAKVLEDNNVEERRIIYTRKQDELEITVHSLEKEVTEKLIETAGRYQHTLVFKEFAHKLSDPFRISNWIKFFLSDPTQLSPLPPGSYVLANDINSVTNISRIHGIIRGTDKRLLGDAEAYYLITTCHSLLKGKQSDTIDYNLDQITLDLSTDEPMEVIHTGKTPKPVIGSWKTNMTELHNGDHCSKINLFAFDNFRQNNHFLHVAGVGRLSIPGSPRGLFRYFSDSKINDAKCGVQDIVFLQIDKSKIVDGKLTLDVSDSGHSTDQVKLPEGQNVPIAQLTMDKIEQCTKKRRKISILGRKGALLPKCDITPNGLKLGPHLQFRLNDEKSEMKSGECGSFLYLDDESVGEKQVLGMFVGRLPETDLYLATILHRNLREAEASPLLYLDQLQLLTEYPPQSALFSNTQQSVDSGMVSGPAAGSKSATTLDNR